MIEVDWVRHTPLVGEIPAETAQLVEYIYAASGVFARARREGLEAIVPVARCSLLGVGPLEPRVTLTHGRIPASLLASVFATAASVRGPGGEPIESLFYFCWDEEATRWSLEVPAQEATPASVRPLDDGPGSAYARALVELHSHHEMAAYFSAQDDADETGFRIYAVIGELSSRPSIRVRVGVHGYRWEVPADWIFELPVGVADARETSGRRPR